MKPSSENKKEKLMRRSPAAKKLLCVFLALILIAASCGAVQFASLFAADKVLACEYEVHEHTDSCYDDEGNMTCGYADYVVHAHNSYCYDEDGELVCELDEIEVHEHTDECYETVVTLTCGEEESEGHTHDDSCYEIEYDEDGNEVSRTLTCEEEESEGHTHTDGCYEAVQTLTCGKEEVILHTHTDDCYDIEYGEDGSELSRTLTCTLLQVEEHNHTSDCLASSDEDDASDSDDGVAAASADDGVSAAANSKSGTYNGTTYTISTTVYTDSDKTETISTPSLSGLYAGDSVYIEATITKSTTANGVTTTSEVTDLEEEGLYVWFWYDIWGNVSQTSGGTTYTSSSSYSTDCTYSYSGTAGYSFSCTVTFNSAGNFAIASQITSGDSNYTNIVITGDIFVVAEAAQEEEADTSEYELGLYYYDTKNQTSFAETSLTLNSESIEEGSTEYILDLSKYITSETGKGTETWSGITSGSTTYTYDDEEYTYSSVYLDSASGTSGITYIKLSYDSSTSAYSLYYTTATSSDGATWTAWSGSSSVYSIYLVYASDSELSIEAYKNTGVVYWDTYKAIEDDGSEDGSSSEDDASDRGQTTASSEADSDSRNYIESVTLNSVEVVNGDSDITSETNSSSSSYSSASLETDESGSSVSGKTLANYFADSSGEAVENATLSDEVELTVTVADGYYVSSIIIACSACHPDNEGTGESDDDSTDSGDDSGSTGDDSGSTGDDSGSTGDDSGSTGDDSGSTGDNSGGTGGNSGSTGGNTYGTAATASEDSSSTTSYVYESVYLCATALSGNAFDYDTDVSDTGTITLNITNLAFSHEGYASVDETPYYFILITVKQAESPVYVEYDYGNIDEILGDDFDSSVFASSSSSSSDSGTDDSSSDSEASASSDDSSDSETTSGTDAWLNDCSGNIYTWTDGYSLATNSDSTYSYPASVITSLKTGGIMTMDTQFEYYYASASSDETAQDGSYWKHYANTITEEAAKAAAEAGYYFAGWTYTYYYEVEVSGYQTSSADSDGNTVEYDSSSGNNYTIVWKDEITTATTDDDGNETTTTESNIYGSGTINPGEDLSLYMNVKLTAIWLPVTASVTKTVTGLSESGTGTALTYGLQVSYTAADPDSSDTDAEDTGDTGDSDGTDSDDTEDSTSDDAGSDDGSDADDTDSGDSEADADDGSSLTGYWPESLLSYSFTADGSKSIDLGPGTADNADSDSDGDTDSETGETSSAEEYTQTHAICPGTYSVSEKSASQSVVTGGTVYYLTDVDYSPDITVTVSDITDLTPSAWITAEDSSTGAYARGVSSDSDADDSSDEDADDTDEDADDTDTDDADSSSDSSGTGLDAYYSGLSAASSSDAELVYLAVTNTYSTSRLNSIQVVKVDSETTASDDGETTYTYLSGASFVLYRYEYVEAEDLEEFNSSTTYYTYDSDSGSYTEVDQSTVTAPESGTTYYTYDIRYYCYADEAYIEVSITEFEDGVIYYTYDSSTGTYIRVGDDEEYDSDQTYYYIYDDLVTWEESAGSATVLTTDSNGTAYVFSGLDDGTYYLLETQAPDGYYPLDGAIVITIESSGTYTATYKDETVEISRAAATNEDGLSYTYLYTVTVPDTSTGLTKEADASKGSVRVGENITFTITSIIPETTDSGFVYTFTDTMTDGLTLTESNLLNYFSVKLAAAETASDSDTDSSGEEETDTDTDSGTGTDTNSSEDTSAEKGLTLNKTAQTGTDSDGKSYSYYNILLKFEAGSSTTYDSSATYYTYSDSAYTKFTGSSLASGTTYYLLVGTLTYVSPSAASEAADTSEAQEASGGGFVLELYAYLLQDYAGGTVTISYKAQANDNANATAETNTVTLTYGTQLDDGTYASVTASADVYTAEVVVYKVDASTVTTSEDGTSNYESAAKLSGASFVVYKYGSTSVSSFEDGTTYYTRSTDSDGEYVWTKVDTTETASPVSGTTYYVKKYYKFTSTFKETTATSPSSGTTYYTYNSETDTYEVFTGNYFKDGTTYYEYNSSGKVDWTTDIDEAAVFTTDENGTFTVTGLDDTWYFLTETAAPDGYDLLTSDLSVHVTNEGDTDENILSYTVYAENSSSYILPETGGRGIFRFIFAGLVLLWAGTLGLLVSRRRRERRAAR